MRAIDTNVIVRFVTADDPRQARAARAVIAAGDVFVSATVLLETEWVLRGGYGLAPGAIAAGLRALGGLPGVTFEEPDHAARALDWMEAGMDFADALHLVRSGHCDAFASFDRKLAKRAMRLGAIAVEAP